MIFFSKLSFETNTILLTVVWDVFINTYGTVYRDGNWEHIVLVASGQSSMVIGLIWHLGIYWPVTITLTLCVNNISFIDAIVYKVYIRCI